jgi:hypothetical protein
MPSGMIGRQAHYFLKFFVRFLEFDVVDAVNASLNPGIDRRIFNPLTFRRR